MKKYSKEENEFLLIEVQKNYTGKIILRSK